MRAATDPCHCGRKAHARGMCITHYSQWRVSTPPEAHPMPDPDPVARYHSKVAKGAPDECWPWTAGRDSDGYGVHHDGGSRRAHRYGWELVYGPIPDGLLIRHSCDNPPCQNPAHMSLGTVADNSADMVERGRQPRVPGQPEKLTDAQVAEIRSRVTGRRGEQKEMAAEYGVSRSLINIIVRGRHRVS